MSIKINYNLLQILRWFLVWENTKNNHFHVTYQAAKVNFHTVRDRKYPMKLFIRWAQNFDMFPYSKNISRKRIDWMTVATGCLRDVLYYMLHNVSLEELPLYVVRIPFNQVHGFLGTIARSDTLHYCKPLKSFNFELPSFTEQFARDMVLVYVRSLQCLGPSEEEYSRPSTSCFQWLSVINMQWNTCKLQMVNVHNRNRHGP